MADNPTAIADAIEALTIILRRDLERVWARVSAQVDALEADWPAMGAAARRRRLLELQANIAGLADAADEIAARHVLAGVRDAYLLGAHATALTVGGAVATTGVDLGAITHLATDTHADLLHATTHMRSTTKDLIRTLARDHVSDRLYTGTPATQAGRDLAKAFRGKSIAAIVYKDGSRHGLASYADMVVRTKTAEAYQIGGFNQAESHGVKFMEVMDGPNCGWTSHDDTTQANGLILPLDEARAWPISHPNCRRTTMARPDIKSLVGAKPMGPQFTAQQLEDAAKGKDVGFRNGVARRSNGTMAPAAAIAKGPAATRAAALQAKTPDLAAAPTKPLTGTEAMKSLTKAQPKLNGEDAQRVRYYTGDGFSELNKRLRTGTAAPADLKASATLDKIIGRSQAPHDLTVLRGVQSLPGDLRVGSTFTDKGFSSTTLDSATAKRYAGATDPNRAIMRIRVPKGTPALSTKGLSDNAIEHEVLLRSGTSYRVVGEGTVKGAFGIPTRMLDVEVIPALAPAALGPAAARLAALQARRAG